MTKDFTEVLRGLDFVKKAIEDAYEKGYRVGKELNQSGTTYLKDAAVQKIAEKHYSPLDMHHSRWVFTDEQLFAFVREVIDEVSK